MLVRLAAGPGKNDGTWLDMAHGWLYRASTYKGALQVDINSASHLHTLRLYGPEAEALLSVLTETQDLDSTAPADPEMRVGREPDALQETNGISQDALLAEPHCRAAGNGSVPHGIVNAT